MLRSCLILFLLIIGWATLAQTDPPLDLPATPNITDSIGRKQGFWFFEKNDWGSISVDQYVNDITIRRYGYYPQGDLFYEVPLTKGKYNGVFKYYAEKKLADLYYYDNGKSDLKKSVELCQAQLKLAESIDGGINEDRITWLVNVAHELEELNQLKESERYHIESIEVAKKLPDQTKGSVAWMSMAEFYNRNELYKKAIDFSSEYVKLVAKEYGLESKHYLYAMSYLVRAYEGLGMKKEALSFHQDRLTYYKAEIKKDSTLETNYIGYYSELFNIARNTNDEEPIKELLREGVKHWNISSNSYNDNIRANAFMFYRDTYKDDAAMALANEGLKYTKVNTTEHIDWLLAKDALFERVDKYTDAEIQLKEALAIYDREEHGNFSGHYLNLVRRSAQFYSSWGQDQKAKYYYQLVVKGWKELNNPLEYSDALKDWGSFLIASGEVERGEKLMQQALDSAAAHDSADGNTHLNISNAMATAYWTAGLPAKAELIYLLVLEAYERNLGKDHLMYATQLETLGDLYTEMGFFDKAQSFYEAALRSISQAIGNENGRTASLLFSSGKLELSRYEYYRTRDYKKAIDHLNRDLHYENQALALTDKLGAWTPRAYATSISNLGLVYLYKGFYQKAEGMFEHSRRIYDSLSLQHVANYSSFCHNLGLIHQSTGQYKKSREEFNKSIQVNIETRGPESDALDRPYEVYGTTLWRQGDWKNARHYLSLSNRIQIKRIENLFLLTEAERENFWDLRQDGFYRYYSFLAEDVQHHKESAGTIYDIALAIKGLLLQSSSKWKDKIRSSNDSVTVQLFDEWEGLKLFISKEEVRGGSNRKFLDSLTKRGQEIEKSLTSRSAYFSKVASNKIYHWQDVRKKLGKDEAAIEIVRIAKLGYPRSLIDSTNARLPLYPQFGFTDTVYYAAMVIKANSSLPEMVLLKNGADLEKRFLGHYKNSIEQEQGDTLSYRVFWKPLANRLRNIKRVYISNDGVYNMINLNTLRNPSSNMYILDEIELVYVTNTKDLIDRDLGKQTNKQALLMGMPDYDQANSAAVTSDKSNGVRKSYYNLSHARRGNNLDPLPGTQEEVEQVADLLEANHWHADTFLHQNATEEVIKANTNPAIMHIATHGFFQEDEEHDGVKINPLVRSGVLLAGAKKTLNNKSGLSNDQHEDGVLTAYEAMSLDLDSTELVVLSACETGLGKQKNGEGVYGLQRAFKVAGAKSLIMSMWKVDDDATRMLMTRFYKYWLTGIEKSEAFAKAQRDVRETYPQPVYWGGFILMQ